MMSEQRPLISVIIPVYNSEKYLAESIGSVLSQTWRETEIIVVDDGSTDRSNEIAMSFPGVRYEYQKNQGPGKARNLGFELSKGNFVAFLDSDDIWLPHKLELQMKSWEQDTAGTFDAVAGYLEPFLSPELDADKTKAMRFANKPIPGHSASVLLFKRPVLLRVGLFETEYYDNDFVRWFVRATDNGLKILDIPEVVARRRIHETNMGRRLMAYNAKLPSILKESLDRRRKK